MNFRTADTITDSPRAMTKPQQFLVYQSEYGAIRIDVMLVAETLWLRSS